MKVYKINYFITIAVCLIFVQTLAAQDSKKTNRDGWIIGFQLNEFGKDFGLGFNTITPKLWGLSHIQLSYDYQYLPFTSASGENWKEYQQVRLSLITKAPIIKGVLDVYGGGGIALGIFPKSIQRTSVQIGGTGAFGMNLYWYEGFSYFFEMGGTGGLGSATQLPGKPVIGSGFYTSTGFRLHFN